MSDAEWTVDYGGLFVWLFCVKSSNPVPRVQLDGVVDIALAEFNSLRTEINNKETAQLTLVGLNLTATAAICGLALARRADPRIMLVLPVVCSALGILHYAISGRPQDGRPLHR